MKASTKKWNAEKDIEATAGRDLHVFVLTGLLTQGKVRVGPLEIAIVKTLGRKELKLTRGSEILDWYGACDEIGVNRILGRISGELDKLHETQETGWVKAAPRPESYPALQKGETRSEGETLTALDNLRHTFWGHPSWVYELAHEAYELLAHRESDRKAYRDELLGQSFPWPVLSCLDRLEKAADHLLHHHNCDCWGYEEIQAAMEAARGHRDRILAKERRS